MKVTVDPATWQGPERLPQESFEDYKVRRAEENKFAKVHRKGVRRVGGRGTYVKPKVCER